MIEELRCGTTLAPAGWYCTRFRGHKPPCCAIPLEDDKSILERLMTIEVKVDELAKDHDRAFWWCMFMAAVVIGVVIWK
jgi:hypothetical protein